MVTWKTSDPVSGTVVSYTNDGTANTGFVSEQTEPLGQSVALTDPEPPNEPSTYEQHLFFASEPEWQCEAVGLGAYGSLFKDRPEHCQRKALYAAGAHLPWEGEVTSVLKISKPTNPLHEALHQLEPAQETMQKTLSITDKFASGGPSSGGEEEWYQSGVGQWSVYVTPDFPSDVDLSLDPAFAGDEPPLSKKKAEEMVANALPVMQTALEDRHCSEWLQSIMVQVLEKINGSSFTDAMKTNLKNYYSVDSLYDKINKASKFYEPRKEKAVAAEAQEGAQKVTFYRGTFQFRAGSDFSVNGDSPGWRNFLVGDVALTLIHEAVHLWGAGFTDEAIGEILTGEKVSHDEGSAALTKAIEANCGGVVGRRAVQ